MARDAPARRRTWTAPIFAVLPVHIADNFSAASCKRNGCLASALFIQ